MALKFKIIHQKVKNVNWIYLWLYCMCLTGCWEINKHIYRIKRLYYKEKIGWKKRIFNSCLQWCRKCEVVMLGKLCCLFYWYYMVLILLTSVFKTFSLLAVDICNIFPLKTFCSLHKEMKMGQRLFQCLETLQYGFCMPSRIRVTNFQSNL